MSTKNSSRFTPVIIAISVVIGILIGTFYAKHFAGNRLGIINGSSNKLNALLRIVDDQYVDTVNMTDLVEKAMPRFWQNSIRTLPISRRRTWKRLIPNWKAVSVVSAFSSRYKTTPSMLTQSFPVVLPRKWA